MHRESRNCTFIVIITLIRLLAGCCSNLCSIFNIDHSYNVSCPKRESSAKIQRKKRVSKASQDEKASSLSICARRSFHESTSLSFSSSDSISFWNETWTSAVPTSSRSHSPS